ncbi:uncharacterized protein LOC129242200 [Anastrepha obliqua]|uniref:uncharacterized protein LOC129242200 n=1 Tax=Anastrepha obliqua TaxID=95512 RepID=UPI002409C916|nr:uncharacterized protein LOC129242200 [Anastrepha obliqua]
MVDTRLSFKQHLAAVNNKAAAVMGALTKILPNIGGPQGERRKLLSTVVDSIILYAAPVWAEAKNTHMREVILTGHGCFMEYLHRFQLAESPFCPSCPNAIESAEHVAFHCDRFARERAILESVLGHSASPNDIVQDMCSSSAKWVALRGFAGKIMLRLQFIEWERKTQQQQLQLQLRNGQNDDKHRHFSQSLTIISDRRQDDSS